MAKESEMVKHFVTSNVPTCFISHFTDHNTFNFFLVVIMTTPVRQPSPVAYYPPPPPGKKTCKNTLILPSFGRWDPPPTERMCGRRDFQIFGNKKKKKKIGPPPLRNPGSASAWPSFSTAPFHFMSIVILKCYIVIPLWFCCCFVSWTNFDATCIVVMAATHET